MGHGARPLEGFLGILAEAGIEHLVDVRTAPGSRRHPHFGRDRLAAALHDAGIRYSWRKDLGGWRRPLPDSPHSSLTVAGFRGYADYMDSAEFSDALAWLEAEARSSRTAFMCAESLWSRCHRRMIADALHARGWRVIHLLAPGRADEHRLHPVARAEGTRVLYDMTPPRQQALPT
ncbi:MAG: DUF488 family protein [Actinomycetota bacterium]